MNSPKTNPLFSRIAAGAALFVVLSYGTLPAVAQVQEYEGFNYSGTALTNQNGGTGWGSSWTNTDGKATLSNDGVSLAFPASVSHVAQGSRITFAGAGVAERRLGTTVSLAPEGNIVYFSALVKRQGYFKFEFLDNAGNSRWRMGATTTTPNNTLVGVDFDSAVANVFPTNQTVFMLGRMVTHVTPTHDQVSLNIYKAGDTVPASEPTTWQATLTGASGVVLTRLRVQNFDGLPLEIDELRIGTNYLAVAGPKTNTPPVASAMSMGAQSGVPQTLKIIGGKYSPTDVDGDPLIVSAVENPSPNGAAVTTDGTNVTYTAAGSFAGADTFAYVVSDGVGGFGANTVTITVGANGEGYNLLQVSGNNLTYLGIPGTSYALEHTGSLSAPVAWGPVVTNQTAADGRVTFDTGGVSGFYRTSYVSGP